jgi:aspartate aminotransferase-like enzyme
MRRAERYLMIFALTGAVVSVTGEGIRQVKARHDRNAQRLAECARLLPVEAKGFLADDCVALAELERAPR